METLLAMLDQAVIHELLEEERRGSCRQQISAVRAAVIARRDRAGHALALVEQAGGRRVVQEHRAA